MNLYITKCNRQFLKEQQMQSIHILSNYEGEASILLNRAEWQATGIWRLTIYASCEPFIHDLYPCASPSNIYAPPDYERKDVRGYYRMHLLLKQR